MTAHHSRALSTLHSAPCTLHAAPCTLHPARGTSTQHVAPITQHPYLSFNVVKLNNAKMIATMTNRVITFGSLHPINSK